MGIAGNLKTMELAELLQWLAQGQKTGTLVVDHEDLEKRVFFQKGKVISSASTDPKEHLGHFLVSHGFITEQQLGEGARRQEAEKSMLGKTLVGMGAISAEQLDTMLRLKAQEGIFSLFDWPEGEFRFHDDELPPYEMVPISLAVTGLVLEAMRRQDEWKRIRLVISSMQMVPVKVVEDLIGGDDELEEGQKRVLLAVDDDRSIEQISLETHASEYYVCESLYPRIRERKVKLVRPRALPTPPPDPTSGGPMSAESLLKKGLKHLKGHEYEPALRHLRAARNLDPDNQSVQVAVEQGERSIRQQLQKEGVVQEAVPQLALPFEDIARMRVSPKAGFLLTRVNGSYDIAAILKISPMPPLEALLVFRDLVKSGIVKLARP